jgi:tRNA (cytidine32/uridine32-2'-O)-methyltransferase
VSIAVVLQRPQNLVNIARVVRAMQNFGIRDLRLVAPAEYDASRIQGIAHKSAPLVRRVRIFDELDEALADCAHVAGMSARQRTAKRNVQRPREAAGEVLAAAELGVAALVLGPEDRGLTNAELDRCHRVVVIPTHHDHPSLNLAQAFTVMAYELYLASGEPPLKPPRRVAPPATQEQLERLLDDAQASLDAIEFFKTRSPTTVMRTVRDVTHRAPLDRREVKLLRAMCLEVLRYLERKGVR